MLCPCMSVRDSESVGFINIVITLIGAVLLIEL